MTERAAWVRADGKRPIRCDGSAASSTNRATWSSFDDVTTSSAGDGFGIMLGDGLGCIDLDHCLEGKTLSPEANAAIANITEPIVWVERSMSGTGLHIFIRADEAPGWKRGGVERYTRQRFIRVTGDRFTL